LHKIILVVSESGFVSWVSAGGAKRAFVPLEIGTKKEKFLENVKSAVQFRLVGLIFAMVVFLADMTLTLHKSGPLFR